MKSNPILAMLGVGLAERLFHRPRKTHHRRPEQFGLHAELRTTRTSDGITLDLWLIPGAGRGVVIAGHGIGLTKSACLRHAALLHEPGHHVIMFDHRNHGLSDTDPARTDLAERHSLDIHACHEVAGANWPEAGPPIVWGFSFSTFPTICMQFSTDSSPVAAHLARRP